MTANHIWTWANWILCSSSIFPAKSFRNKIRFSVMEMHFNMCHSWADSTGWVKGTLSCPHSRVRSETWSLNGSKKGKEAHSTRQVERGLLDLETPWSPSSPPTHSVGTHPYPVCPQCEQRTSPGIQACELASSLDGTSSEGHWTQESQSTAMNDNVSESTCWEGCYLVRPSKRVSGVNSSFTLASKTAGATYPARTPTYPILLSEGQEEANKFF